MAQINNGINKTPTTCKIDGKVLVYNACSDTKTDFYKPEIFEYMGYGEIYSINGKVQKEGWMHHFWKHR